MLYLSVQSIFLRMIIFNVFKWFLGRVSSTRRANVVSPNLTFILLLTTSRIYLQSAVRR
eukprot:m.278269 g.278269  ORF g.278269 m.278269 type:complete len:59 (+) comp16154_c1_seq14:3841-4017(+)